jgi:CRISPR type III-A-associated RAMP protein Csm4
MQQALLVRLRPSGPWRYGPSDGALDRVDTLYRSDRLFSAITLALRQLGHLDTWLDATARSEKPAVAFTSLFPFQGDTLFVTPPANLWPPPSSLVNSPSPVFLTKVRWRAAHFVPLSLVDALLTGQSVLADQWIPDPDSGCLLRRDRPSSSPFRTVTRATSPVDRLSLTSTSAEPNACVEFEPGSGLWTTIRFADDAAQETWAEPLKSAFRLLADTGFGGGRSKGWGQVQAPEFESGVWPSLILPKTGRAAKNDTHEEQTTRSYWLLSLYSPSPADTVNWSGGQYELTVRNGRVDGSSGALKKSVRMVVEGCILDATAEPIGTAVDVAPPGFAHSVYRSGIALSLLIPPMEARKAVEEIVPPELEATPFPFPTSEPTIEEPTATDTEPLAPTPEPTPAAPEPAASDPEPPSDPEPTSPEPEPPSGAGWQPAAERPVPLPIHPEEPVEPIIEVIPEDLPSESEPEKSPKDPGYEI